MNILITRLHNDYPLAPEKLSVSQDMLSKYCKRIADKYEIKVGDIKKLIPDLGNKTNYVVYYRNLQLYLSLGMKLTKIHKVLKCLLLLPYFFFFAGYNVTSGETSSKIYYL